MAVAALTTVAMLLVGAGVVGQAAADVHDARVGHAPVVPAGAAKIGVQPPSTAIKIDVVLKPRDSSKLHVFLKTLYDPSSPTFHHFLSKGQFGSLYGASPSTVHAVESTLRSLGLSPDPVRADDLIVGVTTTVGAAESAFHIQIDRYRLPSGQIVYDSASAPLVPASIASDLTGIIGLTDSHAQRPGSVSANPIGVGQPHRSPGPNGSQKAGKTSSVVPHGTRPTPCATASSVSGAYTANQLADAYGFNQGAYTKGDLGAGETIALFELAGYTQSTVTAYEQCYGISTTVNDIVVTTPGTTSTPSGVVEVNLDIDDVAGLAPMSTIDVYENPNSSTGLTNEYARIATDDSAQVVSSSWGSCELDTTSTVAAVEEYEFEQMGAQGQSMLAASGDTGSEGCVRSTGRTTLSAGDPSSDPYVTGVGGTEFTSIGPPPLATVWHNKYGAGGGGISQEWSMPTYQQALGINSESSGVPCGAPQGHYCREVPDVSANASYPGGYAIYDGGWQDIGGTSAATPLWASLTALADERCGGQAGFLNPALYTHESALTDIVYGTNDFTGTNGHRYPATAGYDMASGLGAPTAALFTPGVLCSPLHVTKGTTFVATESLNAIDIYPPGTNTAYEFSAWTIKGPTTGLDVPTDVKVSAAGDVFVSNYGSSSITEYAANSSGNIAPICTIQGTQTRLVLNDDLSLEADGALVVASLTGVTGTTTTGFSTGSVEFFAPGSCGNVAPEQYISGPATGFDVVDGVGTDAAGDIFAMNSLGGSIEVFAPTASGNVAPLYTIAGPTTGLGWPDDAVVAFNGELYVTNGYGGTVDSVEAFAPGASGNAKPLWQIKGSTTQLTFFPGPDDLAIDTTGDVYVTDNVQHGVLEWNSAVVSGHNAGTVLNVAPSGKIVSTSVDGTTEGVAVSGPPLTTSATLTVTAAASSIAQGASTSAIATLSGGTAPSGSIVFKLFGPNNSTCSLAPVDTSTLVPVTGDGTYTSPTYVVTSPGTYEWQVLYSGDTRNAPETTPCGVPGGVVTVTPPTAPSAPTNLHETSKSRTSVSLAWTSPSSTGGNPITHYIVDKTGSYLATLGATRAYDVGGLSPGSSYHFTVEAQNAVGTSAYSNTLAVVTTASPASISGYDLAGSDGGVFVFPTGQAGGFYGSLPGLGIVPNKPIVGMVPTVDDRGYFLVGADGGVFSFGNAPYLGSLPGLGVTPAQPITGIVAANTDKGYFLVGADGGVYAFGTVPFLGSLPGLGIHVSNIIGIAATPKGTGYWLISATGTVDAFGKAQYLGTARGETSPVSAIAGTPTGGGYWITTKNGSVASFGNAKRFGTLPELGVIPALPVIGIVHTAGTGGYWLIGSDGGIFAFGTAPFVGSLPGIGVKVSDVVGAVPTDP